MHPLTSHLGHIFWISETLAAATKSAPQGLTISIRIYVTGATASEQQDNISVRSGKEGGGPLEEEYRTPSLLEDPTVQITRGSRPNLKQTLREEADFTDGGMGVTGSCFQ